MSQSVSTEVPVIGGGPAGLVATTAAAENGRTVTWLAAHYRSINLRTITTKFGLLGEDGHTDPSCRTTAVSPLPSAMTCAPASTVVGVAIFQEEAPFFASVWVSRMRAVGTYCVAAAKCKVTVRLCVS